MTDLAIQTTGLTKSYSAVHALDGLSLNVPCGSIYGFLGRNGAGKSTMIRILLGLATSDSGSARVLGFDVAHERVAILERTAFVSERKALYEDLTPAQMLRFTAGFYPAWSHSAAEKYSRLLEIPMKQKIGKLSHGNRTKVCLMLALAQQADVLMLDEPTTGLDAVFSEEVLRVLIEDYAASGRTIFFSTHNMAEIERIADWVGIIDHGRLLLETRLDDIRDDFRAVTVSGHNLPDVGQSAISITDDGQFRRYVLSRDSERFTHELRQQGANVIETSPMSLREVFLAVVRKDEPCTPGNVGTTVGLASCSAL